MSKSIFQRMNSMLQGRTPHTIRRVATLILVMVPLTLVAADCHTTNEEARIITSPAPARKTNALISGHFDVSTMQDTDRYLAIRKSEHVGDASTI